MSDQPTTSPSPGTKGAIRKVWKSTDPKPEAPSDRVSLHGAKPEDVLRTMLATPPRED